jgi:hypothetical protein
VKTLKHSPYSLDLSPAVFYLSLDWNQRWRDSAFFYATDIIKNTTDELKRLLQNGF